MSQLFASGGQSIGGASALASVLPVNIQGWFPLVLTGLISLMSKGLSRVFSSNTVQKHQFFSTQVFFMVQLSHPYVTARKTIAFEYTELCHPSDVSIFNMLSWFVIAFLPKNKCLWVSWLLSPCTSDFGAQKNKICHSLHFFLICLPGSDETGCHDLCFLYVEF